MGTLRKDLDGLLNRVWNAAIMATLENASGDIGKLEEWMKRKRKERPPLRPGIPNIATPEPKTPQPERLQPRFSPRTIPVPSRNTNANREKDGYSSCKMSPQRQTSSRTSRNAASPERYSSSTQAANSHRKPPPRASFPPRTSSLTTDSSSTRKLSCQGSFPSSLSSSPGRISTPGRLLSQGSTSSAPFYYLRRPMSRDTILCSSPASVSPPIVVSGLTQSVSETPHTHLPGSTPAKPLSSVLAVLGTFTSERQRDSKTPTPRWKY